jgi:hypothetical protein
MASFIDHLWQSALFTALAWALSTMLRRNSATLRAWIWRIAAVKFVLPFSLLFAFGAWLGFPVRHSAVAPPAMVSRVVDTVLPIAAPTQSVEWPNPVLGIALVFALALATACLWWAVRNFQEARASEIAESKRVEEHYSAAAPPPGFLKSLTLAGSALALMVSPVVGGALRDRVSRQQSLAIDTLAMRAAAVTLTETDWRFGDRTQIVATVDGVSIRKINLQDLVALVYGIGQFEVFGGALPWLESPHYDVRVNGSIHSPAAFDPYSLREPVTQFLSEEFGVAIRVNGSCQEPCLNQESFVIERLPWTILERRADKRVE